MTLKTRQPTPVVVTLGPPLVVQRLIRETTTTPAGSTERVLRLEMLTFRGSRVTHAGQDIS